MYYYFFLISPSQVLVLPFFLRLYFCVPFPHLLCSPFLLVLYFGVSLIALIAHCLCYTCPLFLFLWLRGRGTLSSLSFPPLFPVGLGTLENSIVPPCQAPVASSCLPSLFSCYDLAWIARGCFHPFVPLLHRQVLLAATRSPFVVDGHPNILGSIWFVSLSILEGVPHGTLQIFCLGSPNKPNWHCFLPARMFAMSLVFAPLSELFHTGFHHWSGSIFSLLSSFLPPNPQCGHPVLPFPSLHLSPMVLVAWLLASFSLAPTSHFFYLHLQLQRHRANGFVPLLSCFPCSLVGTGCNVCFSPFLSLSIANLLICPISHFISLHGISILGSLLLVCWVLSSFQHSHTHFMAVTAWVIPPNRASLPSLLSSCHWLLGAYWSNMFFVSSYSFTEGRWLFNNWMIR